MTIFKGITNFFQSINPFSLSVTNTQMSNREADGSPKELTRNTNTFVFQQLADMDLIDIGYKKTPAVYAMIDFISKMASVCLDKTGRFYEIDEYGEKKELYEDGYKYLDIVKNPRNSSFTEFITEQIVYLICAGEMMVWKNFRYGLDYESINGKKKNPIIELTSINPIHVAVIGGGIFSKPTGYKHIRLANELAITELFYRRLANPNWNNTGMKRGFPKLGAVQELIQIDKEARLTQAQTFNNRGVNDIISPKGGIILEEHQAKNASASFEEKYNSKTTYGKRVFSPLGVDVTTLGRSLVEMDILSMNKEHIKEYSNVLGVSGTIFEVGSSVYKEYIQTALEMSIYHGVLPIIQYFIDLYTEVAMSYVDDHNKRLRLEIDIMKAFPEIKATYAEFAIKLSGINGIHINEIRSALGLTPSDEPNAEMPIVSRNMTTVDMLDADKSNNANTTEL